MKKLSYFLNLRLRKLSRGFKPFKALPLRTVLVVPFVLQITAAVGLTGWLSYWNGQAAVHNVTVQLRDEVTARIQDRLKNYLETPHIINELNRDALQFGELNPEDFTSLERRFWSQMRNFNSVSSIALGSENGEFVAVGLPGDRKRLLIGRAGPSTNKQFLAYEIDATGKRGRGLTVGSNYDPRLRPWYQKAIRAGKPVWSDIYTDFVDPRLAITDSHPIYAKDGTLKGVLAVDLVLSQVGEFLQQIKVGKSGQTFILERSGLLVAVSTAEAPYIVQDKQVLRVNAIAGEGTTNASQNPIIRASTQYLVREFSDLRQIVEKQQLKFNYRGEQHFLQVTPLQDRHGLDWLIVVVLPEKDFTERIQANNRLTILLCFIALVLASVIGIKTSHWITRPLLQLSNAAKAFSEGREEPFVPTNRQDELGMLTRTFNQMLTLVGRERRLFVRGPVTIFRWRLEEPWQVEYVSPNVVQFGYHPDELLSGKVSYASIVHPDDVARVQAELEEYEATGVNAFEQDYRIIRPDGEVRWVYDFTVRVRNSRGEVTHHEGYVLDITERKQAEQQVQELNRTLEKQVEERTAQLQQKVQELQDLYQRQDEFLHAVSHDLRTPLNGMLLVLKNLMQTAPLEQGLSHNSKMSKTNQAESSNLSSNNQPITSVTSGLSTDEITVPGRVIERMLQSSDRQLRLINSLLETHASEVRGIFLQWEAVHLDQLVHSIVEDIQVLVSQHQATLSYQVEANLPMVMADPLQLRRVFENLLTNSLNHNPPGLHLSIFVHLEGKKVHCMVQDNGIGMSQEQGDRLFERYARGSRARSTGIGLGLYLCRLIINAHGGEIGVISSPQQGAQFWFTLPLSQS